MENVSVAVVRIFSAMRSCELLRTENAWVVACSTVCILAHTYWQTLPSSSLEIHEARQEEEQNASTTAAKIVATMDDALRRAHKANVELASKLRHVQDELAGANARVKLMEAALEARTRGDETAGANQAIDATPLQLDALEESDEQLNPSQRITDADADATPRDGESRAKLRSRQVRISEEPEPDWLQEAAEVLTPTRAAVQQWQARGTS